MEDTNNILQDKIRLYDQENGTELARFVAFLERGKVYEGNEARFFHVGKTGELLQKYGMKGDITIGRSAFSQRHTAVGHKLNDNDWIKVIKNINNPLAIAEYLPKKEKSFRLYTTIALEGNVVCVGVTLKKTKNNVEICNIGTAFWRDIRKIGNSENEILIYPEP